MRRLAIAGSNSYHRSGQFCAERHRAADRQGYEGTSLLDDSRLSLVT